MSFNYEYLMEYYGERIAEARKQLKDTWEQKNTKRPAVILGDVNYALCGQKDIPDNYFEPEVMFRYQMEKIIYHMENIFDDYVPVFHPWYGTTVVPSALGVEVCYQKGLDPSLGRPIINDPEDVRKLKMPDFEKDGQMPRVLKCIDYVKNHTDVPVCVTDTQGPLNIALSLTGVENLFLWMYEEPDAVHDLMKFCTRVLIEWIKIQKRHAGHQLQGDAYPHATEMPSNFGGVAFADDDIVAMGSELYQEFVVPYNEQVMSVFGGGSMHFCGSAMHQLDTMTKMNHLGAVNNFCMGNFEQVRMLQEKMKGHGAVMAYDFNAADIQWHCEGFKTLAENPIGLILGIFITPEMALLENGKYASSKRNAKDILMQYYKYFKENGLLSDKKF